MTAHVDLPKGPLYLTENQDLMQALHRSIVSTLKIDENSVDISTHFMDPITQEVLEGQKFTIAVDHSLRDKFDDVRNIAQARFGLRETDFSINVASVFLKSAAQDTIDKLTDIQKRHAPSDANCAFGNYGIWGVMQTPSDYNARPTIVLWFNNLAHLNAVAQLNEISSTIEIDNGHGTIEDVQLVLSYNPDNI